MKININDVAKKAGLSTVTVSRVINNAPSVREYNRQKVLNAMRELGYTPSAAARTLAKGKTGIIGLIAPSMEDPFFNSVIKSINYCLLNRGYFLAISLHDEINNDEINGIYIGKNYLFQDGRVDGIIILSPTNENEYIQELEQKGLPFILIDNQESHTDIFSIIVDNYKGGYDITKYLLNLGHTKIGFIGGNDIYLSARERRRGFIDALKDFNLEPFIIEDGDFTIGTGYEIMEKWIKNDKIPTAVFASDDKIALGAINACQAHNIKVPQDISICGYDNLLIAAELRPHLTTVQQPVEQMGKKAAEIMLQLIQGYCLIPKTIKLPPKLIIRDSTQPPNR